MKALVYGRGISGKGSEKLLIEKGYSVEYVSDDTGNEVLDDADLLVLSPSVPLERPLVRRAELSGIEVVGEMELASRYVDNDIIAVTGTNGKTTTTMMISSLLTESGLKHKTLGNIGKSFAGSVGDVEKDDMILLEVSSFQLETITSFRPKVAILLNIAPDHLERHKTYDEYVRVKTSIFENMTKNDFAIANYDDEAVRNAASGIMPSTYYFSVKERVRGAYVQNGHVFFMGEKMFPLENLKFKAEHNIANALAVITLAKIFNIPNSIILRSFNKFTLPPHRIEFVGRYNGKNYFNDSKATNIDATIKAVKSMRGSTALIVGGYDKGISYYRLFASLDKKVKCVVIFGQNRHRVEECIKDFDIRYYVCDTLSLAITSAKKERVENVLFSPATSSYDMFRNYEERGEVFTQLVGDINEK